MACIRGPQFSVFAEVRYNSVHFPSMSNLRRNMVRFQVEIPPRRKDYDEQAFHGFKKVIRCGSDRCD
jgi:hypothetical protein